MGFFHLSISSVPLRFSKPLAVSSPLFRNPQSSFDFLNLLLFSSILFRLTQSSSDFLDHPLYDFLNPFTIPQSFQGILNSCNTISPTHLQFRQPSDDFLTISSIHLRFPQPSSNILNPLPICWITPLTTSAILLNFFNPTTISSILLLFPSPSYDFLSAFTISLSLFLFPHSSSEVLNPLPISSIILRFSKSSLNFLPISSITPFTISSILLQFLYLFTNSSIIVIIRYRQLSYNFLNPLQFFYDLLYPFTMSLL